MSSSIQNFPAGSRVVLKDIVSRPELNGQVGIVLGPEHNEQAAHGYANGRVPVAMLKRQEKTTGTNSGEAPLLIKPGSLELYKKTLIFVYGTLKRFFTNHVRYLSVAECHGGAKLLHYAVTVHQYPLVIRPPHLLPATCGPVLVDREGDGHCIRGEVWEMDERTVAAMDILEGVKEGHYYKKRITVRSDDCTTSFMSKALIDFRWWPLRPRNLCNPSAP